MHMHLTATVQHHASAVYIINALHVLLYPTMTCSWPQGLPFHSPVYNTLQHVSGVPLHVCRFVTRSTCSLVSRPSYFCSTGCIASLACGKEGLETLAQFSCALEEFAQSQWCASCHVTFKLGIRMRKCLTQRRGHLQLVPSQSCYQISVSLSSAVITHKEHSSC